MVNSKVLMLSLALCCCFMPEQRARMLKWSFNVSTNCSSTWPDDTLSLQPNRPQQIIRLCHDSKRHERLPHPHRNHNAAFTTYTSHDHHLAVNVTYVTPESYRAARSVSVCCLTSSQHTVNQRRAADSKSSYSLRKHLPQWPPSSEVAVCRNYES